MRFGRRNSGRQTGCTRFPTAPASSPGLPYCFIERLTEPGNVVHDPFMGRGTTLIEAALLGRVPCGCDVSPLSLVLTRPRLRPPTLEQIRSRLAEIDFNARRGERRTILLVFFHPGNSAGNRGAEKTFSEDRGALDTVDEWICAGGAQPAHRTFARGSFRSIPCPPDQAVSVKSQQKSTRGEGRRRRAEGGGFDFEEEPEFLKDCDAATRARLGAARRSACA